MVRHMQTLLITAQHILSLLNQILGAPSILLTNFLVKSSTKSPILNHNFFLFQVTKMCCIIQLQLRIWNIYRNWIIQHILVTLNRKIGDLKLVILLVTSPKNWWLEWTARLSYFQIPLQSFGDFTAKSHALISKLSKMLAFLYCEIAGCYQGKLSQKFLLKIVANLGQIPSIV